MNPQIFIIATAVAITAFVIYINRPRLVACMKCAASTRRLDGFCCDYCRDIMTRLAADRIRRCDCSLFAAEKACICWKAEIGCKVASALIALVFLVFGSSSVFAAIKPVIVQGTCESVRANHLHQISSSPTLKLVKTTPDSLTFIGLGNLKGVTSFLTFKPVPLKDPSPEAFRVIQA